MIIWKRRFFFQGGNFPGYTSGQSAKIVFPDTETDRKWKTGKLEMPPLQLKARGRWHVLL